MDKTTIDAYNKMAKEYDEETTDFWERFPVSFIDKFISLVEGKVLDVGSGPGRDGLLLKEKGLDVTCIDASSEMVRISTLKGLDSMVGDFLDLPFENSSFDAVWAYTSLLHVPKASIGKALSEIRRVLKSQGVFGLGLIEGEQEAYKESSGMNMPRLFCFYTKEEIERLLKEQGFDIVHFETFKPGSKNYLNYISKKV